MLTPTELQDVPAPISILDSRPEFTPMLALLGHILLKVHAGSTGDNKGQCKGLWEDRQRTLMAPWHIRAFPEEEAMSSAALEARESQAVKGVWLVNNAFCQTDTLGGKHGLWAERTS